MSTTESPSTSEHDTALGMDDVMSEVTDLEQDDPSQDVPHEILQRRVSTALGNAGFTPSNLATPRPATTTVLTVNERANDPRAPWKKKSTAPAPVQQLTEKQLQKLKRDKQRKNKREKKRQKKKKLQIEAEAKKENETKDKKGSDSKGSKDPKTG